MSYRIQGVSRGERLTVAESGSHSRVHHGLVDSLNGVDRLEVGVKVREGSHDSGPDESALVVVRRLQLHGEQRCREPHTESETHVELKVLSATSSEHLVGGSDTGKGVVVVLEETDARDLMGMESGPVFVDLTGDIPPEEPAEGEPASSADGSPESAGTAPARDDRGGRE